MRFLPRTVVILGCVSLLNDAASEMITPLLPIFLASVLGAGPAVLGLVEGVAESTSSLLKLISGRMADRGVPAKSLVLFGYTASNLVRPLIGAAFSWTFVLALRFLDRVGKGIRTAPRDALIAGATEKEKRGAAFGFHRSMDHAGAVIGPLIAYFLLTNDIPLKTVFYGSLVPGLLVVLLLFFGLSHSAPIESQKHVPLRWRSLDTRLRALILTIGLLALSAVPEVFVVLWAREAGLKVAWIPLLWAAASLAKMSLALPAGALSDRIGRLPVFLLGLGGRVIALSLLAFVDAHDSMVWVLFLFYSISLAISEPAERALVGDHAKAELRGTAFDLYHLASGLCALPGAFCFGLVWQYFSASTAFTGAAVVTTVAGLLFLALSRAQI